jgi:DNA-binding response OmpR family regulator
MVSENIGRRVAVIIEDDADIRNLLEAVLIQAGFETVATRNGLEGIAAVRAHNPIVTTLDVSMPGMDGFETARRIRDFSSTYLVMLTARDDEIDTLQGLDAGADDYLTKPFRPRELRARIEAMLRRPRQSFTADSSSTSDAEPSALPQSTGENLPGIPIFTEDGEDNTFEPSDTSTTSTAPRPTDPRVQGAPADGLSASGWFEHNGLKLNPEERLVQLDGIQLELTRTEFDLMNALLDSQRRVRSKNDLALLLRGEAYASPYPVNEADRRAVEVHMGNLRRKLGDSNSNPRWLETVRGVGYRLAAAR